jgi:glycosyltransferase involved in cell wall biosynthesis
MTRVPDKRLKSPGPAVKKLILAGIIQDQAYYDQYVAPHIDNDKVVYIGSVGPVERNRLLGKACALLHPIQFDEPFGLSVIESMACGTPVIAFDRGSMPELIENGKNGFLVNNVDEAIEAVARIQEIDRAACRRHVERHFTVDRMIDEYIQVYEMILQDEKIHMKTDMNPIITRFKKNPILTERMCPIRWLPFTMRASSNTTIVTLCFSGRIC